MKFPLRFWLGAGSLGLALAGAAAPAAAFQERFLPSNPGSVSFSDTGVTPAGTVLRATLYVNSVGAGLNVTQSNSGIHATFADTYCANGQYVSDSKVAPNSSTTAADIQLFCNFGVAATDVYGYIDDYG